MWVVLGAHGQPKTDPRPLRQASSARAKDDVNALRVRRELRPVYPPEADLKPILPASAPPRNLFNHLVGEREKPGRYGDAQRFRSPQIDH